MIEQRGVWSAVIAVCALTVGVEQAWSQVTEKKRPNQYEFGDIKIPPASADEPIRENFSLRKALDYLEQGTVAWSNTRGKCVSCHTNGSYMLTRPALTPHLGKPPAEHRQFFVQALETLKKTDRERLLTGFRPTQAAYIAAGLAEWDQHVTGKLTAETDSALRLMFELQSEDGSWGNADCWPPLESSAYHGATVAAIAAMTAPGWRAALNDQTLLDRVEKLKTYLLKTRPPHDYGRLLLLWTSSRWTGLLTEQRRQKLIEMVFKHQRKNGGWSMRTFAAPDAWGNGSRAEKLRTENHAEHSAGDGHQTGLSLLVLRDAGVSADDKRMQRGVRWLLSHQRNSGRWWTRSLNTDRYHFITYSGSCYSLLALAKCNALPTDQKNAGRP